MFYLDKGNERAYIKKGDDGFYIINDFRIKLNDLGSFSSVVGNDNEDIKKVVYYGIAANIVNKIKIDLSLEEYKIENKDIDDLVFLFSKMLKSIAFRINETMIAAFDYELFLSILKKLIADKFKLFTSSIGSKRNSISMLFDTGLPLNDIKLVENNDKDFLKGYFLLSVY